MGVLCIAIYTFLNWRIFICLKKTMVAFLMSFALLFHAMPTHAFEVDKTGCITHNALYFSEINDVELRQRILEDAARLNSINLSIAEITVYDNGVVVYFHPFPSNPFDNENITEDFNTYGVSAPTQESPDGNKWKFSGSASSSATMYTNYYVIGSSLYNLEVNNTGTANIRAIVKERGRGILGLFTFDIHTIDIAAGGSSTATKISTDSSKLVIKFF